MNRTHRIALPVAALGAAALFIAHQSATPTPADGEPAPPIARDGAPSGGAASTGPDGARRVTVERRHRLHYDRLVTLGAGEAHLQLVGTWTVLPLGPDRVQVQLEVDDYIADDDAPAGLELPFQLGYERGRLRTAGYARQTSPAARNLLAEVATAVTYSPGEGDLWRTDEVDLNGAYEAHYIRRGDGEVQRRRIAYHTLHAGGAGGSAEGLLTTGTTRFQLDEHGPTLVRVDEGTERRFAKMELTATAQIEARLERERERTITLPRIARLSLRPIAPVADPTGVRKAERNLVGDADMDTVMGWLARLDDPALVGSDRKKRAAGILARTAAFLRLTPEAIDAFAAELLRAPAERARFMTSALGSAGTAEATAALTELLAADIDGSVLKAAHVALNRTAAPSAESARALLADIDHAEHGDTAMLAAANQVRTLDGSEPEVAGDVIDELVARYAEAADAHTRALVVTALGNTGDPRITPVLADALRSGDASLARYATYAYRHVPGADVDNTLEALLVGHPIEQVRIQAIQAINHRDADGWNPRLEAALPHLAAMPHARAAVELILKRRAQRSAALAQADAVR